MAFTQQTFLGASIRSFNGTIGWGSTPSRLTVQLVEDPKNGDSFSISIGAPVIFSYSGWTFAGIIKSYSQNGGSSGNPLYSVILEDPRSILGGTELILNNYTGSTFGVPNLLNVYGYFENTLGFGASDVTNAGIPWKNVRDGVVALTTGANASYGDNIVLGSYSYEINLDQLPDLPEFYRFPAQDTSLLNFIDDICQAANHEYYFTLDSVGAVNLIKLHTINRNIQPVFGAITDFVNSTPGAVQKNAGLEFRDEVTSKFLVGGNVTEIFHNSLTGGDDEDFETGSDNNIWPYWGTYSNGNVVIGEGINNAHTILLDASWVEAWPFSTYPTDVGELRAAIGGQSSWETYLWLHNNNIYREDANGDQGAFYRDPKAQTSSDVCDDPSSLLNSPAGITNNEDCARWEILTVGTGTGSSQSVYKHDNVLNPHFGKASTVSIGSSTKSTMAAFLSAKDETQLGNVLPDALAAFDAAAAEAKTKQQQQEEKTLFEYVKAYAEEYYGKKFMVRIPFVLGAEDSDTGEIRLSREPVDAGFLDESVWPTAISTNLLSPDVNKFSTEDGRIIAYVRYLNASTLDFGDINVDDLTINETTDTAFVKVQVEPVVQFVDRSLLYSPRVVINMPGIIRKIDDTLGNDYAGVVRDFLINKFQEKGNASPEAASNEFFKRTGSDILKYDRAGLAILPNDADIPLRSNITTYGPWYAAGANGKLDFEADESLVPWNYGGFDAMNNAANARISSAISNIQVSEAGSIEFPGAPAINMGSQLQASGPHITDINVQISNQGVTTTYQMKTWTPQPYKLRKDQAEVETRSARNGQRLRRQIREGNKTLAGLRRVAGIKATKFSPGPKKEKSQTTHTMITGEMTPDGTNYKTIVGIQPTYNLSSELNTENYIDKGSVSLNGLFQPYSVTPSGQTDSKLPAFESPSENAVSPTIDDLNPFIYDSNISAAIGGSEFRDISNEEAEGNFNDVRSVAFRGPIIISGPGYDNENNPVPAGNGVGGYPEDIHKRPNLWKTGPLDARWNDDRKVWEASGGTESRLIRVIEEVDFPTGSAKNVFAAKEYVATFVEEEGELASLTEKDGAEIFYVANFRDVAVEEDAFFIATKIEDDSGNERWVLDHQLFACVGQNAVMQIAIIGSPTAGSFDMDLTINSVTETLTFQYNDDDTAVTTELETHSEISSGDVAVSAGPFPDTTMVIEFQGNLANTNIILPTMAWASLIGTGVGVIPSLSQLGISE